MRAPTVVEGGLHRGRKRASATVEWRKREIFDPRSRVDETRTRLRYEANRRRYEVTKPSWQRWRRSFHKADLSNGNQLQSPFVFQALLYVHHIAVRYDSPKPRADVDTSFCFVRPYYPGVMFGSKRCGVDGRWAPPLHLVQGLGAWGQRRRENGPCASPVRQGVPRRVHAWNGGLCLGEEFQPRGPPAGSPRGT